MQIDEMIAKMTPVFRDVFDNESLVVTPATTADDVDGWDSLSNIRLMIALEKAFGLRLKAAEVANLKNVGDLAGLITSKLG